MIRPPRVAEKRKDRIVDSSGSRSKESAEFIKAISISKVSHKNHESRIKLLEDNNEKRIKLLNEDKA